MGRLSNDRTGEIHQQKDGRAKIIAYRSWNDCEIQFLETGSIMTVYYSNLVKGTIKDPLNPSVFNVGFPGIGSFSARKHVKLYDLFTGIHERCSYEYMLKHPTYADCTVVKRWHNFQNFCEDIIKMANWNVKGFDLDKDFRVFGNKKYGPKYCSFVPQEINKILNTRSMTIRKFKLPVGVLPANGRYASSIRRKGKNEYLGTFDTPDEAHAAYKRARIKYVRRCAVLYKKILHPEVYSNLANWTF